MQSTDNQGCLSFLVLLEKPHANTKKCIKYLYQAAGSLLDKCKGLESSPKFSVSVVVFVTFIKYVFTCLNSAEVLKSISLTPFQMFHAKVVAVKPYLND